MNWSVMCTAGMGVARPLPNLDVYGSLNAAGGMFHLASPSAVMAAAAAAAVLKCTSTVVDHRQQEPQLRRLPLVSDPPRAEPHTAAPSTAAVISPSVTAAAAASLIPSLGLPLLSPGRHSLLPTLGFTLEQVLRPYSAVCLIIHETAIINYSCLHYADRGNKTINIIITFSDCHSSSNYVLRHLLGSSAMFDVYRVAKKAATIKNHQDIVFSQYG